MTRAKSIFNVLLVSMLFGAAAGAQALTFSAADIGAITGAAWQVGDGEVDGNGIVNDSGFEVTSSVVMQLLDYQGGENGFAEFHVTFTNTTNAAAPIGFTAFGFSSDPVADGAALQDIQVSSLQPDDDRFLFAWNGTLGAFPDSPQIDISAATDVDPSATLQPGESDTFLLTMFFDNLGETLSLDTFNSKFQVRGQEYLALSVVPLPSAAWLFGTVLLVLAGINSRHPRRRVAA